MVTTNRYELTIEEVKTLKWALLVLRTRDWFWSSEMTADQIVELEIKLKWNPEG